MNRQRTDLSVGIGWVQALVATAQRLGAAPGALLTRSGLGPLPADPLARVPLDAVVRLWRAAAELTGDNALGLRMGQMIEPTSFNVVAYTLLSSATLREAFGQMQRFGRLVSDGARLQLVERGATAWLVYHPVQDRLPFSPIQAEATLSCAVRLLRWVAGADFAPTQVCFTHAAMSPPGLCRQLLGCEVAFSRGFSGIALPAASLDTLLPARNPELCRLHEALARQHLATLEQGATVHARVKAVLPQMLAQGLVQKEAVAALLGLSARALQQRLAAEGTGFAQTLDEVRHALALQYLQDPMLSLGQIAVLLNFSDASAFYRAFRRWTGTAPGALRRRGQWAEPMTGAAIT